MLQGQHSKRFKKQSTYKQIHVLKMGRGSFTFLYRVSSSTFMSRSCANTGGREGNGLMGFGSARILPSSPNHFLPWGSSRGKDNVFF